MINKKTIKEFLKPDWKRWWNSRFIKAISYYAQKNELIGVKPWFINSLFFKELANKKASN